MSRPSSRSSVLATAFILGICVAVAVLAWFGYTAGREWRRNSELLASRRAMEMADLLVRALVRDMRGAHDQVLRGVSIDLLTLSQPHELTDTVATAFARYPYPESFFAWTSAAPPDQGVFFARADRVARWVSRDLPANPYPVSMVGHGASSRALVERAITAGAEGRPFAVFETVLGGESYQVVARVLHAPAPPGGVAGVFAFIVNLDWVRETYFRELTNEVQQIFGTGHGLSVSIEDDRGTLVAGGEFPDGITPAASRTIRPLFFDPSLVALDVPPDLPLRQWTVRVSAAGDPGYAYARQGAERTVIVTTAAAVAFGFGLLLAARALRASARLAQLRADFVASVTHELKTPLATIQAVGETLARGRMPEGTDVREYAQIVDEESKRLTRLVDNLLAYSRVTDLGDVYSFEQLAVADLVDDIVRRFQPQFAHRGVDVEIDIPPDLPPVAADRTALELVMDNLVDNALRYAGESRWIAITAERCGAFARIAIRDKGMGIPQDKLARVETRFVRGRRAAAPGSGLGLAIASRIVRDHGGRLDVNSRQGQGTTVYLDLPVFAAAS